MNDQYEETSEKAAALATIKVPNPPGDIEIADDGQSCLEATAKPPKETAFGPNIMQTEIKKFALEKAVEPLLEWLGHAYPMESDYEIETPDGDWFLNDPNKLIVRLADDLPTVVASAINTLAVLSGPDPVNHPARRPDRPMRFTVMKWSWGLVRSCFTFNYLVVDALPDFDPEAAGRQVANLIEHLGNRHRLLPLTRTKRLRML